MQFEPQHGILLHVYAREITSKISETEHEGVAAAKRPERQNVDVPGPL